MESLVTERGLTDDQKVEAEQVLYCYIHFVSYSTVSLLASLWALLSLYPTFSSRALLLFFICLSFFALKIILFVILYPHDQSLH